MVTNFVRFGSFRVSSVAFMIASAQVSLNRVMLLFSSTEIRRTVMEEITVQQNVTTIKTMRAKQPVSLQGNKKFQLHL